MTTYDYGEILFTGRCNLSCFYCLGREMEKDVYDTSANKVHFRDWKNFNLWLSSLKDSNTPKIYLSSTNSEPLLYPYLEELILFLKDKGFKVGIRTNGFKDMAVCSLCNEEISVSLQSLNPDTFKKITGKNLTFDIIKNIRSIKSPAPLRVSIVVNRYNEKEVIDMLEVLKNLNISYVQLRKVYKYNSTKDFDEDILAYYRVKSAFRAFKKIGNFKESEIFDYSGLNVSFWDNVFSKESIRSSNYWTDGRCTLNNLLVPGYKGE